MIHSLIHPGSGLGNQLFRYVAGRVRALDLSVEYSAIGRDNFKGKDFMNLDFGPENKIGYVIQNTAGKIIPASDRLWEESTNYYNPEFNFVKDGSIIDGEFQDERYFQHRIKEIDRWLAVDSLETPSDLCVIGFRGGEFYLFPELGLPKSYFEEGIERMKMKNPKMRFEVHTDDPILAKEFFPDYDVIHNIGVNWRAMRYAKNAIIANSSFYILPRLLNGGFTIAPRYWARRNTKEWSMPQNYYKYFMYV